MIVRHIIFAGLFATASFANAGTVGAGELTVQPAFTFNAGTASAEPKAMQSSLAGFAGGTWSANDRMGDKGSSKTMVFSNSGGAVAAPSAAAPIQAASSASSAGPDVVVSAAPAAAAVENAAVTFAAPPASEMATVVVAADVISADAQAAVAAIPEPATGMLMLAGLLGAGFLNRRRK